MFVHDGVGGWMDRFAALEAYCNEGDVDWGRDANERSDLDLAFYTREGC